MAAPEPSAPCAGDTVAGKYQLVRPIGLGAMGLIFEATHLRMRQRVAIKFMQPKLVEQPEAVARFEREGRAASGLTSPHATRIFDVDTTVGGIPYIVSELLEGRDLRQELDERGKLPAEEAVTYVIQACAVMAEAHALGIVHRDLKPSNLFLATTGSRRIVKVLDFGISKMKEEHELTSTGVMLGSPRYMSPEQVEAKDVDRRADIWSLGVILFRAISGGYPFEGGTSISLALAILSQPARNLCELVPETPPELAIAVKRALSQNLSVRYSTVRDFAEALAPYATPEAADLARSLTRELPASQSSKAALYTPTPGSRTLPTGSRMNAEIDVLLTEMSTDPPEQATRGTWAHPLAPPVPPPNHARTRVLAGTALVVVLGAIAFARFGWSDHSDGAASRPGSVTSTPSSAIPPATMPSAPDPPSPSAAPWSASAVPSQAMAIVASASARTVPRSAPPAPTHLPPPAPAVPHKNPTYL
jgi:serine/threonine protein kinase